MSYKPGGEPPTVSVTITMPRRTYVEPRHMYRPGYICGGYEYYGLLATPPTQRLHGAALGVVAYISASKPGSCIEHGVDTGGLYLHARVESGLYCIDAFTIPYHASDSSEDILLRQWHLLHLRPHLLGAPLLFPVLRCSTRLLHWPLRGP